MIIHILQIVYYNRAGFESTIIHEITNGEKNMDKKQIGLVAGSIIGAVLGAGAAYLLMTNPAEPEAGEEPAELDAGDLLGLTATAALFIRKIDDVRRKI